MNMQKSFFCTIGSMIFVLLLTGCQETPSGFTTLATSVAQPAAQTTISPTSNTEPIQVAVGDTFTTNAMSVKLTGLETRKEVIVASGDSISFTPSQPANHTWLLLSMKITNTTSITLPTLLLTPDSTTIESDSQQYELWSVGTYVEGKEGSASMLGTVEEQHLTKGFLIIGAKGNVFVRTDVASKVLFSSGTGRIIGDAVGPEWDLGSLAPRGVIRATLLFAIPSNAEVLTWNFLDVQRVELLEAPVSGTSKEKTPNMSLSMTDSEVCKIAKWFALACPDG